MRFSEAAERLLVTAGIVAGLAITAAIVIVGLRARQSHPTLASRNPQDAISSAAQTVGNVPGLRPQSGTTKFWLDFIAFDHTSLAVGSKPTVPTIEAGAPLRLSGWAIDERARNLGAAVFAQIDNRAPVAMNYHMPRPDVARFFHQPAYLLAGFGGSLPTDNLSSGVHLIFLDVINHAGSAYYRMDTKQRITVRSRVGR